MKNKLIRLSAFLLIASTIFTGCNTKGKEDKINSYDKQEQLSNINNNSDDNTSNSNMVNETSNLTNDSSNIDVNITTNESNTQTSNSKKSNTTAAKSSTKSKSSTVNLKSTFKSFANKKGLKVSQDVYDKDALKKIHCIEAMNATRTKSTYTLELYLFDNTKNAKAEYSKQVQYQKDIASNVSIINNKSTNSYDIFEAITKPNLDKAPRANKNESSYMLYVRINNGYILMYETSTDSNKNDEKNIAKELKKTLGI